MSSMTVCLDARITLFQVHHGCGRHAHNLDNVLSANIDCAVCIKVLYDEGNESKVGLGVTKG
jgi:hypothetical protein